MNLLFFWRQKNVIVFPRCCTPTLHQGAPIPYIAWCPTSQPTHLQQGLQVSGLQRAGPERSQLNEVNLYSNQDMLLPPREFPKWPSWMCHRNVKKLLFRHFLFNKRKAFLAGPGDNTSRWCWACVIQAQRFRNSNPRGSTCSRADGAPALRKTHQGFRSIQKYGTIPWPGHSMAIS